MNRTTLALFRMIPAVFFLFPVFHASGQLSLRPPRWWDVELRLTVKGQYSVREADAACAGEFFYAAAWSGSMEKDDADFLLYHSGSETLRWEALEKISSGGEQKLLTEKDFSDRPLFRMNYVLNENGVLRFNFIVDGFPVPRSGAGEKFDLILPASKKEESSFPPSGYDASVSRGSNEIVFEEKKIRTGPVERAFRWEWKRYQPSSGPGTPVVLFNNHKAEVKITITPRYEILLHQGQPPSSGSHTLTEKCGNYHVAATVLTSACQDALTRVDRGPGKSKSLFIDRLFRIRRRGK